MEILESIDFYVACAKEFSALQTITGINQKQLAHYAAGRLNHDHSRHRRLLRGCFIA